MTERDLWDEAARLVTALDRCTYYELLDIAHDADPQAVRDAFVARATRFHPDRHAATTDLERARMLVSLQARFNEAYRTLSNPARRADYDRALATGTLRLIGRSGTLPPATHPSTPQARRYFDLACQAERSGDPQGAAMYFGFALQLEPESAAIRAGLARLGVAVPDPAVEEVKLESRSEARHPFAGPIELRCRSWRHFLTLHTRDLSRGGLFVKTSTPFDVGTRVQIAIVLPDDTTLQLEAEVVHVVAPAPDVMEGMGMRFDANDDQRSHIEVLVRHAAAAAREERR